MATKYDGGLAFPGLAQHSQAVDIHEGMSLRDWFAGQALVGIAHWNRQQGGSYADVCSLELEDNARLAYQFADAMLAEREKHE